VVAVLDSSAVVSLILQEPGFGEVFAHLDGACMSTVNHAETIGVLCRGGMPSEVAAAIVDALRIDLVPFSADHAHGVGVMHVIDGLRFLSLGDRACLTLARELGASVVTADRAWADIDLDVGVVLIR